MPTPRGCAATVGSSHGDPGSRHGMSLDKAVSCRPVTRPAAPPGKCRDRGDGPGPIAAWGWTVRRWAGSRRCSGPAVRRAGSTSLPARHAACGLPFPGRRGRPCRPGPAAVAVARSERGPVRSRVPAGVHRENQQGARVHGDNAPDALAHAATAETPPEGGFEQPPPGSVESDMALRPLPAPLVSQSRQPAGMYRPQAIEQAFQRGRRHRGSPYPRGTVSLVT